MKGTVQFNSNLSEPFNMCSGVKQGCVLTQALFGIFFALLLRHAFGTSQEGIYLQTRSDSSLFNLACLKARTKVHEALIRDMLFADDAAVVTHTPKGTAAAYGPLLPGLQRLQADHQSEQDIRPGPRHTGTTSHHHQ